MVQDYSIQGIGKINGGEFKRLSVEGVGTSDGAIKADILVIEGVFHSNGTIETDVLDCEGVGNINGKIQARKMTIEGVINIKDASDINAMDVYCEGCINTSGDLYAETFRIDGCVNARDIYGNSIEILSHGKVMSGFKKMMINFGISSSCHSSRANLIKADTIRLEGVKATNVMGNTIIIGPGCEIETVECKGELKVHENAIVKNIVGVNSKDA